jgi:hypothetical protein
MDIIIKKLHPKATIVALIFTLTCVLAIVSVQYTGVDWIIWQ